MPARASKVPGKMLTHDPKSDKCRGDYAHEDKEPVRTSSEGPFDVGLGEPQGGGGWDDEQVAEQVGRDCHPKDDVKQVSAGTRQFHGGEHEKGGDDTR